MKQVSVHTLALVTLFAFGLTYPSHSQAEGWGDYEATFELVGEVPQLAPLVAKGSNTVKDAGVCSVEAVPNEAITVDAKTKAIGNVFIYIRSPSKVHPDSKTPKAKEITFDQKNCTFLSHGLVVQTGQTVKVLSDDDCAHNVHSYPLRNTAINFLIRANDRKGVSVKKGVSVPEILPFKVTCDFHTWMKSWWLVVDHPYAAVSGKDGKITIKNLPEGEVEFRIWHESAGYLERAHKVEIVAGKTKEETIKIPVAKFELADEKK